MNVLVELAYDPRPPGPYRTLRAELTYKDSASGTDRTMVTEVEIDFVPGSSVDAAGADPTVAHQIELARASRDLDRTVMGMRTQQISPMTAMIELQKTQRILLDQGRTDEAAEIGKAVAEIQAGAVGGAEKTLVGAVLNLDQGKERSHE